MSLVGILCLVYAGILLLHSRCVIKDNHLKLVAREKPQNVAVLIAAREESAVIEGLLKSLEKQTWKINPKDIYVIVERRDDPTVEICRRHGNTVVLREDLKKQRKGFALDDAVRQILKSDRHYDAYFIFDADNILEPDYIAKMLECYSMGYDLATGYRNSKNANANVIAAVSSLTFSMINVMSNHRRLKYDANIIFSGTGYFVTGDLIEEWQGWPFRSLTEDYEISLYATLHGLKTFYNEDAMFYDEQPTKFGQTVAQRVRWVKGYFAARHKYIPLLRVRKRGWNLGSMRKECVGVKPAIWAVIGILCILVGLSIDLCMMGWGSWLPWGILGIVMVVYVVLAVVTVIMIRREKTEFTSAIKVQAVLFNPIYLVTYIPCALMAIFSKNVTWKKIEHGGQDRKFIN